MEAIAVLLFPFTSGAQRANVDSTRQLYNQLQKLPSDTSKVKALIELGTYIMKKPGESKGQTDSGLVFFDQGIALAQKLHSVKWENFSNWKSGENLYENRDTIRGASRFQKALAYYTHTASLAEQAEFWLSYGDKIHFGTKDPAASIPIYNKAISLFMQVDKKVKIQDAKERIANVHVETGKIKDAAVEFLQVEQEYTALGDLRGLLNCQLDMALMYWQQGNIQKALSSNLAALKSARKLKSELDISNCEVILGGIYFKLKMFKEALPYMERSVINVQIKNRSSFDYSVCVLNVVLTRVMLNKIDGLMDYLIRSEKLFRHRNSLTG